MKPLFCPNCHRRIEVPKWILKSNIKVEKGITLACAHKPCKGKVKFKPEVKEEVVEEVKQLEEQHG